MSSQLMKPKLPVGGLALGPNDLDAPPGNFYVAENVVHRRAGVLEPMAGENYFMDGSNWQYSRVWADWEPNRILRIRKQTADSYGQLLDDINGTFYAAQFQPGETQAVYADDRHIFSGAEHVTIVENRFDASGAPRRAGLPQPAGIKFATFGSSDSTSLNPCVSANKYVAWKAVVRRSIVNGRTIQSAPCSGVRNQLNASHPQSYTLRVFFQNTIGADSAYQVGDEIAVFRTAEFDSVAEINDSYYLAVTKKLTSTDISNQYADLLDGTLQTNLGEELYTNPGQQGSLKANSIPPRASGVEAYLGTTFYINKQAQPNANATVVGSIGPLPAATTDASTQQRKNGIGSRTFTGDTTTGSPNITNVSAAGVIGLAVGQRMSDFFSRFGTGRISSITGSGPYTVVMSTNSTQTSTGDTYTATDTLDITAIDPSGGSHTSKTVLCSTVTAIQESLRDLQDLSSVAMRGFVLNSASLYFPNSGIVDTEVLLNFAVLSPDQYASFTLSFSNPGNWVQGGVDITGAYRQITSVQETRRNVVWYSKTNLPEDVSPVQFILVGNGTVYRLLNVQSCMLAFCSDGLFKITGEGDNWIIVPVDNSVRLVHPDCAYATGSLGFAWLEKGLCAVSETGAESVSDDAIGPQLKEYARTLYATSGGPRGLWGPQLVIDRNNSEVWLNIVYLPTGSSVTKYATYLFNTNTGKFTTAGNTYTALSYYPSILNVVRAKNGPSGQGLYRQYFPPDSLSADYLPATVVYMSLNMNAGEIKQWVDVNYFFDNVPVLGSGTYNVEALFGGELTSSTNLFGLNASQAPGVLFALHSLVPRRCGRDVELQFGFRTSITPDTNHPSGGYYFEFKGASVRARVASQIIKR